MGASGRHEPLFFRRFKEKPCFQPWTTIVINWDGEVYPCTGGEVWFQKQAKSGVYHFGNQLKQHLSDFWNNETYTMLRRTCHRKRQETFVSECVNCHNTGCFKGPDVKEAHILEPHGFPASPVNRKFDYISHDGKLITTADAAGGMNNFRF